MESKKLKILSALSAQITDRRKKVSVNFSDAALEKLEDEEDAAAAEYLKNPVTYSHKDFWAKAGV